MKYNVKGKKLGFKLKMAIIFFIVAVAMNPSLASAYSDEGQMAADYVIKYYESGSSLDEIKMMLWEQFGKQEVVDEAFLIAAEYTGNDIFVQKPSAGKKGGNIAKMVFKTVEKQEYTGKAIKPGVTVKDGSYTLKKGTDYTISYSNNTKIGTAKALIKGKGKYSGSKKVSFQIVPKTVSITSVKYNGTKGSYKITWSPLKQNITGYRIYYSTKPNGKYTLLKEMKKGSKSVTVGNLKKGKMYFFKMTAYLKQSGKIHESRMSEIVYDKDAAGDTPIVLDLKGNSSVSTIYFSSVDKVGKKAYLTWKRPTNKGVTGIQILRKDSNAEYYVMVADIKNLAQNLFIDAKANSKTEKYYIRCVSGSKVGNARDWAFSDNSDDIHWYKGDGAYYRVDLKEKEYSGTPNFKQYSQKTLDLTWNCDWTGYEYNQIAELDSYSNKYQYVLAPADGYYETQVEAYLNVTNNSFEYMWHEIDYRSGEEKVTGFIKKGSRLK